MSECDRSPLLSEWFDGELSADEEAKLLEHLGDCPRCRHELEQLRSLRLTMRTLPADPSARIRVRLGIDQALTRRAGRVEIPWPLAAGFLLLLSGSLAANLFQATGNPGQERTLQAAELTPLVAQESSGDFPVFSVSAGDYRLKASPIIHAGQPGELSTEGKKQ